MKNIYMDHSATTPIKKEVLDEMMSYYQSCYGNASSIHSIGQEAKKNLEDARARIAKTLGTTPDTLYFTSGGSESDNWAIKGIMEAHSKKGNHLIVSKIEHHAVLHTAQSLEKEGYEVTYLDVDEYGRIDPEALRNAIKDETVLISIMYYNNEIGTEMPMKEISNIAKEKGVFFHTDAVQAYGNVAIDVKTLPVDLLSISAHKIYGPKGVGALYVRKGLAIKNLIEGGAQERRRRAGTENIPGIMGFAKAAEIAIENLEERRMNLIQKRDRLIKGILNAVDYSQLNGHPVDRHPGNVNISFEFIEGEALLLSLNAKGIAASSGSACTSGSLDPSHVLMGIGLTHEIAHGSLRLSLGDSTTDEEIDYTIEALVEVVKKLRMMSPLYDKVIKGGNA